MIKGLCLGLLATAVACSPVGSSGKDAGPCTAAYAMPAFIKGQPAPPSLVKVGDAGVLSLSDSFAGTPDASVATGDEESATVTYDGGLVLTPNDPPTGYLEWSRTYRQTITGASTTDLAFRIRQEITILF